MFHDGRSHFLFFQVGFAVIMTGIACWSHMMPGSHEIQTETETQIISGSGSGMMCV